MRSTSALKPLSNLTYRLGEGELVVDVARRRTEVEGQRVRLTRKEFDLLVALCDARGRACLKGSLLIDVWGYRHEEKTRTLQTHVNSLRRKLGCARFYVGTVRDYGYQLTERPIKEVDDDD